MDPIAVKAVGDHSMGIPRRKASAVIAHTASTGFIRVMDQQSFGCVAHSRSWSPKYLGFTGFSLRKQRPKPVM